MPSQFSKPVRVRLGGGKIVPVTSVAMAREVLLAWPPRKRGRLYRAAVIEIIEGEAPDTATMELAFREAAEEAGILTD